MIPGLFFFAAALLAALCQNPVCAGVRRREFSDTLFPAPSLPCRAARTLERFAGTAVCAASADASACSAGAGPSICFRKPFSCIAAGRRFFRVPRWYAGCRCRRPWAQRPDAPFSAGAFRLRRGRFFWQRAVPARGSLCAAMLSVPGHAMLIKKPVSAQAAAPAHGSGTVPISRQQTAAPRLPQVRSFTRSFRPPHRPCSSRPSPSISEKPPAPARSPQSFGRPSPSCINVLLHCEIVVSAAPLKRIAPKESRKAAEENSSRAERISRGLVLRTSGTRRKKSALPSGSTAQKRKIASQRAPRNSAGMVSRMQPSLPHAYMECSRLISRALSASKGLRCAA